MVVGGLFWGCKKIDRVNQDKLVAVLKVVKEGLELSKERKMHFLPLGNSQPRFRLGLLLLVAVSLLYKTQLTSHHPGIGGGGEADAFAQFVLNSLKDTSFSGSGNLGLPTLSFPSQPGVNSNSLSKRNSLEVSFKLGKKAAFLIVGQFPLV